MNYLVQFSFTISKDSYSYLKFYKVHFVYCSILYVYTLYLKKYKSILSKMYLAILLFKKHKIQH